MNKILLHYILVQIVILFSFIIKTHQTITQSNIEDQLFSNQNTEIKLFDDDHCMQYCLECPNSINSCAKCEEKHNCCNWACSTCINQTICTSCQNGFFLDQQKNICVMKDSCQDQYCQVCSHNDTCINCLPGWYIDFQMLTCDRCLPHCTSCFNHYSCLQCDLYYFYNKNTNSCQKCGANCRNCQNASKCIICTKNYFLNESGKCQSCMNNCISCLSRDKCDACIDSYYFNPQTKACQKCLIPCFTCVSKDSCESCETSFFFNKTDNTCKNCNGIIPHCLICFESNQTNYNDENISEIQRKLYSESQSSAITCLQCAEQYFYNSITKQCLQCLLNCNNCSSTTTCNKCKSGYFINSSGQCELCRLYNCIICQNSQQCTVCQSGYFWNSSNPNYPGCSKCPTGCQFCDESKCTLCVAGFYPNNGICYRCDASCQYCQKQNQACSKCLPGYFSPGLLIGICYKCPQPCSQCTNITLCTYCQPGYRLTGNICKKCESQGCQFCKIIAEEDLNVGQKSIKSSSDKSSLFPILSPSQICLKCKRGYILVESTKTCQKCFENCRICNSTQECSQCDDGYYLALKDGKCLQCQQNCQFCQQLDNNKSFCISCKLGYRLNDQKICEKCMDNCADCVGYLCLSCEKGYYAITNKTTNDYCLKCNTPCFQCVEKDECLSCIAGYYLNLEDQCIKCSNGCKQCNELGCFICEQRYQLEYVNSTCVPCKIDNCYKCLKSIQTCEQCEHGYIYYSSSSNQKLAYPTQLNKFNIGSTNIISLCFRCDQKISGCKSCSSPYSCTQCFSGLNLQQSQNGLMQCRQNHDSLLFWISVGTLLSVIIILTGLYVYTKRKYKTMKQIKDKNDSNDRNIKGSIIETFSINSDNEYYSYDNDQEVKNKQKQQNKQ